MTVIMEDAVLEPGTTVRCKTYAGKDIEGEVTAFDINRKAVILGMVIHNLIIHYSLIQIDDSMIRSL